MQKHIGHHVEQNHRDDVVPNESLLTPTSFQMSMTAPRFPPYYTAQRSLLIGRRSHPDKHPYLMEYKPNKNNQRSLRTVPDFDPHHKYLMDHYVFQSKSSKRHHSKVLMGTSQNNSFAVSPYHRNRSIALADDEAASAHPYLPSLGPDFSSQLTRFLGTILPLSWQHNVRDSGGFRWIADSLVRANIPLAALSHPIAAKQFIVLTRSCRRLYYDNGSEDSEETNKNETMKFIDLFLPDHHDERRRRRKGMVFFVHGGAWGSGKPWFYRLVATPFLELGLAVAIVGYRVYPISKSVGDQVNDLQSALDKLTEQYPEWCCCRCDVNQNSYDHLGTIVIGHSSGAHIALLWMVDRAKRQWEQRRTQKKKSKQNGQLVKTFVGISGPYNIDHHFDYEAARGVEEVSPLKAANGSSRINFWRNSPAWRLQDALKDFQEGDHGCTQDFFPQRLLLIHGIDDVTVPFTATSEAARVLKACGVVNCQEVYVPAADHQDSVIHVMLGGPVRNAIVYWILSGEKRAVHPLTLVPQSRL
jgi:acetyl esterase/lipase